MLLPEVPRFTAQKLEHFNASNTKVSGVEFSIVRMASLGGRGLAGSDVYIARTSYNSICTLCMHA